MKPDKRSYFLSGFMGVGKSRIGRELAQLAGIPFVDLDSEIESIEQCSVSDLFSRLGEAAFREIESKALAQICASSAESKVVALGGGAILSEANRGLIRQSGILIYLQASPKQLAARLAKSYVNRPLLRDCRDPSELAARIEDLLAKRDPLYRQASLIVSTDGRNPESIAKDILSRQEVT